MNVMRLPVKREKVRLACFFAACAWKKRCLFRGIIADRRFYPSPFPLFPFGSAFQPSCYNQSADFS